MRKGVNLYSALLCGKRLSDIVSEECSFQINPSDSGFDKTVSLITSRHKLLLLVCAFSEFIISHGLESSFRSFCFEPDE